MSTQPPPAFPSQPGQPAEPAQPTQAPPEVFPPGPDIDIPAPGGQPQEPGTQAPS